MGIARPSLLLFLLYGCGAASAPKTGAGSAGDVNDTGVSESFDTGGAIDPCGDDELLVGGACVAAHCGAGAWDFLPPNDDVLTVFVDAGAADGGDGRLESPFNTISEAVSAGVRVAIGAGQYTEQIDLGRLDGGVALVGRCADLVDVNGGFDNDNPALRLSGSDDTTASASGITFRDSLRFGVIVNQGELTLSDVSLVDPHDFGVLAIGANAQARLDGVRIIGPDHTRGGTVGMGVLAYDGGLISGTDVWIEDAEGAAAGADGVGSHLSLDGLVIDGVRDPASPLATAAVLVQNGGTADLKHVEIRDVSDAGFLVEDASATIQGLELSGVRPHYTQTFARGVAVVNGSVELSDANISGCLQGVAVQDDGGPDLRHTTLIDVDIGPLDPGELDNTLVTGVIAQGATMTLRRVSIHDLEGTGLYSQLGAVVSAEQLEVRDILPSRSGDGTGAVYVGVAVGVIDAALYLRESEVARAYGIGISCASISETPSSLTLDDVQVLGTLDLASSDRVSDSESFSYAIGVVVQSGCVGQLERVTIADGQGVGLAVAYGSVVGEEIEVRDGAGPGVYLSGGTAALSGLDVSGRLYGGVLAVASHATLHDVRISDIGGSASTSVAGGVIAQGGGSVSFEDLSVWDVDGPGLFSSLGAELSCTGCDIRDNGYAGAAVTFGTLRLHDATIEDNGAHPVKGGGVGIYADAREGPSVLEVTNSTVGSHAYAGAWLVGEGLWQISDSTLNGGAAVVPHGALAVHGDAIFATGGAREVSDSAGLHLTNSTLRGADGAGLFLHGAGASLDGVAFEDNATDAWVQDCADGVPAVSGLAADASLQVCPEYDQLTLELYLDLVLSSLGISGE